MSVKTFMPLIVGTGLGAGFGILTSTRPLTQNQKEHPIQNFARFTAAGAGLGLLGSIQKRDKIKFNNFKSFNDDVFNNYHNSRSSGQTFKSSAYHTKSPSYNKVKGLKTKVEATQKYRNLARQHHPDKFTQSPQKIQEEALKKMQDFNSFWDDYQKSGEFDKLAMLAYYDEMNKLAKNNDNFSKGVGIGTGLSVGGAGALDFRHKMDLSKSKHLGDTYTELSKHIKPGDVIIGANSSGHEAFQGEYEDFLDIAKKGKIKKAIKNIDKNTLISKFSHPSFSHAAMFVDKENIAYGSGHLSHISTELPKDLKGKAQNRGTAHFIVVRPNKNASNTLNQWKKKRYDQETINELMKEKAGVAKDYNYKQVAKSMLKDTFLPKINKNERLKTPSELNFDRTCVGGMCSTTPATMSKETVGGKASHDVLPEDFLRSKNDTLVGHVGPKPTGFHMYHLPFLSPKWDRRVGVGLAAGLGAFGSSNAIKVF